MALNAREQAWVGELLGPKRSVCAGGIARLFLASPCIKDVAAAQERHRGASIDSVASAASTAEEVIDQFPGLVDKPGEWTFTRVVGALLLVVDRELDTLLFMIIDLKERLLRFQFELYCELEYLDLGSNFHAFELDYCVAGFQFSDVEVARNFRSKVLGLVASKKAEIEATLVQEEKGEPNTSGGSRSMLSSFFSPRKNNTASGAGAEKPPAEESRTRSWFKFSYNKAPTIGAPTQGARGAHVGLRADGTFDVENIPEEWKDIFREAGIRKKDLLDPKMSSAINGVLVGAGLKPRERTITRSYSKVLREDDPSVKSVGPVSNRRSGAPPPPPPSSPPLPTSSAKFKLPAPPSSPAPSVAGLKSSAPLLAKAAEKAPSLDPSPLASHTAGLLEGIKKGNRDRDAPGPGPLKQAKAPILAPPPKTEPQNPPPARKVQAPVVAKAQAPVVASAPTRPTCEPSKDTADLSKYLKMQKAGLPEGAIAQAATRDGVTLPSGFFGVDASPAQDVKSVGSPKPSPSRNVCQEKEKPSTPAPTKAPPVNPALEKYARMLKSGLPEGAVRHAAARDGVDLPESFFAEPTGHGSSAPPSQVSHSLRIPEQPPSFLADIVKKPALKKASQSPESPEQRKAPAQPRSKPSSPNAGMLDAIKGGDFTLKKVSPLKAPPAPTSSKPAFLTSIELGTVQLRAVSKVKDLPKLNADKGAQSSLMDKLKQCVEERRAKLASHDSFETQGGSDDGWSDEE